VEDQSVGKGIEKDVEVFQGLGPTLDKIDQADRAFFFL
jgi:hypothetical protein